MALRSATARRLLERCVKVALIRKKRLSRLTVTSFLIISLYLICKVGLVHLVTIATSQTVPAAGFYRDVATSEPRSSGSRKTVIRQSSTAVDKRCSSDSLGLPPIVAARCTANSSDSSNYAERFCSSLTCSSLIHGHPFRKRDAWIFRAAVDFFPDHRTVDDKQTGHGNQSAVGIWNDLDIRRMTSTPDRCAEFRRLQGFIDWVDADAVDFPLAYNILLHADAEQAARLLRAIYRPNNIYCIHVDRKSPDHFKSAIESLASCFDNVKLATKPVTVVYEGYSRLQADINCMKDNLNSGVKWKYLLNTAGQAFPLRTVEEVVRILKIYNGSNDFEGLYGNKVIRSRFELEWMELAELGKVRTTGRSNPPPPHGIKIVRGSAYGIFSRAFIEWVLTDRRSLDLLQWSRKTFSPDEFYWSTLHHTYANPHLNVPGSYAGYPSGKPWLAVYVNWGGDHPCEGQWVRAVCVFGVADLPTLVRRPELFANKFYSWFQPITLDCLDQWLRHKEICPPLDDDLEYYRQLPFIVK